MNVSNIVVFPTKSTKVLANGFLTLEGFVKVKFMIFNSKNGPFVTFPSEKYTDKEGVDKYTKYIELVDNKGKPSKQLQQELNTAVLAAYNKKTGGTDQGLPRDPDPQTDDTPAPKKRTIVPF